MDPIILGSNPLEYSIGFNDPITIPVDTLPLSGLVILTNPLPLNTGNSTTTNTYWLRPGGGLLRPISLSDKIVIGRSLPLSNELLSVAGKVYATQYNVSTRAYITMDDNNNLSFTDNITGTKTLAELITGGSVLASEVSIVDSGEYYTSTNVEDLLQEIGPKIHSHSNLGLLNTYTQTDNNLAIAIAEMHLHVNLALLSSYTNSDSDISDAIADMHSHSNFTLLETYDQTNTNLTSAVTLKHVHSNFALLETYNQTNDSIIDAIENSHNILTLGTANGLILNSQALSLTLASASTTGSLSSAHWTSFNNKLDSTTLLTAIKNLTPVVNGIIYTTSGSSATMLSSGTANQLLGINSTADGLEWKTVTILTTLDGKSATGTIDSSTTSYVNPTTGTNITDHLNYAYSLIYGLSSSRTWKSPVANYAALPPSSNTTGDSRITLDTNYIWTWNGTNWIQTGTSMPILSNSVSGIVDKTWYNGLNDFTTAYIASPSSNKYLNKNSFSSVEVTNATIHEGIVTAATDDSQLTLNGGTNVTLSTSGSIVTINASSGSPTTGNLTTSPSGVIIITNGTNAVIGTGTTLTVTKADATHSGYLHMDDWNTFNNAASGVSSDTITLNNTWRIRIDGSNLNFEYYNGMEWTIKSVMQP